MWSAWWCCRRCCTPPARNCRGATLLAGRRPGLVMAVGLVLASAAAVGAVADVVAGSRQAWPGCWRLPARRITVPDRRLSWGPGSIAAGLGRSRHADVRNQRADPVARDGTENPSGRLSMHRDGNQARGAGQAICYEELGIYRLLLQVGDMQELWQFVQDVVSPADPLRRPAQGRPRSGPVRLPEPARRPQADGPVLWIHVKTVAYRIQRIERLTSLDLTNPDHRLSAHVATKIGPIANGRLPSHLRKACRRMSACRESCCSAPGWW